MLPEGAGEEGLAEAGVADEEAKAWLIGQPAEDAGEVVLDEAHLLSEDFLQELAAFLNFDVDSRDLLTLWLVGLLALHRRLQMQHHASLAMRVVAPCVLHRRDRTAFVAMIEHARRTAGATHNLLSDPAMELLFRASRGLPRLAAKLLHAALRAADQRGQAFLDDSVMTTAITDLRLDLPSAPDPPKPRYDSGYFRDLVPIWGQSDPAGPERGEGSLRLVASELEGRPELIPGPDLDQRRLGGVVPQRRTTPQDRG